MTLVIMAAGMGSRFGGLKQIEPVGENNEFIIDYSIYDAIEAGFNKVVFIIKEENYEIFRNTVGKRIEDKIKVEYVFQKLEDIPEGFNLPKDRIKPLGTAHAILECKDVVDENFAVINSDDFYGKDAFYKIKEALDNIVNDNTYAMVLYNVSNTLTENGSVKRGVCEIKDGFLTNLIESSIIKENGIITATPLDNSKPFVVEDNTGVSMNIWGFSKNVFEFLEKGLIEFLNDNINNLDKCEYLLPDVIFNQINKGNIKVKTLSTSAVWHGVTYKEDKIDVVNSIKDMIENGIYKKDLWN